MITVRRPFSYPSAYPLERLGPPEKLLFFDIETTGFSGDHDHLYLIGCVFFREGTWQLVQWFADTPQAEAELLNTFFPFIKDFCALVHFNGDGFDLPFLLKRCHALGLPHDFEGLKSIDLYRLIRPWRKVLGLENLKQKTLEHFLGIFREDPYCGGQLIEVYQDYLLTHETALYDMLMLHNQEDLEGMPLILPILYYCDLPRGELILKEEAVLTQTAIFGETAPCLSLTLEIPDLLPAKISWETPFSSCRAWENRLELLIRLADMELKHFYPNYKDYYYLIYEDQAVHKSVGTFVEREARKKATAQTCFVRKRGLFLPQPGPLWSPEFKKDYRDRQLYARYVPGMFDHPEILTSYVRSFLPS